MKLKLKTCNTVLTSLIMMQKTRCSDASNGTKPELVIIVIHVFIDVEYFSVDKNAKQIGRAHV